MMKHVLLLTGLPGTGKTSLIKKALAEVSLKAGGFYTEEIRSREGVRLGFRLVTLDGRRATLAHLKTKGPPRVSRYGVDIAALEDTGVPALNNASQSADLVIIDEIGKMEMLSPQFREAVSRILDSGKPVLGTIMLTAHPWTDALKRRAEVELVPVTPTNRAGVAQEITTWLHGLKKGGD
jgi:nucleoside-triphosphatase